MRPTVHIVAIAGRKSLGGKTALCLGLAAHYFRDHHRVLVVDLDPRGIASLALGVPAGEADGEHLAAVLNGHDEPVPATMPCGLQLLAGGPALATLANPRPLRDALDLLLDGVEVEVVLVDCPPGHPTLDMLALATLKAGRARDADKVAESASPYHRTCLEKAPEVGIYKQSLQLHDTIREQIREQLTGATPKPPG